MARTLYVAPIPPQNATAGTALASSVTLTDISPAPQITLPANLLDVGQVLRMTAFGVFSTTGAPTLLEGFYYGGVAGVALAATGATATGSGVTNVPWRIEYEGRIRSTGTAGTIMGHGYELRGTSVSAVGVVPIPITALATVTIDTTTAKQITVGAQWGTSSPSNTITCHHLSVELIG
jgi:hypothetical protein